MIEEKPTSVELGFEDKLWKAAEKLRSNLDTSEYRTVVLGLIFLKFISDAFKVAYNGSDHPHDEELDFRDIDKNINRIVFSVPLIARWDYLKKNVKKTEAGKLIDMAMEAIEKDNPSLKGILPKNYSREAISDRLIELISLIGTIEFEDANIDILGRVFEYFLGQFAELEGRKGGQFYTPLSVVRLLVEMIKPFKGRVFDPCCGSGGMFIQSKKFVESHGGKVDDILMYGQESNRTTWGICKMNLSIRGIIGNIRWGDSFSNDLHKNLKVDFILANPPFNDKDWKGDQLRQDVRWEYGIPPVRNANFAWIQHIIHHLAPTGKGGFLLANGSLSSTTSNEKKIRENIVITGLVDCIVTLPDRLFYNTSIPACLWIVNKDGKNKEFKNRKNEVLFIDARRLGVLTDRVHRKLTENDIRLISGTYNKWKMHQGKFIDILGFCKSVTLDQIQKHNFVLNPARYVGIPEAIVEFESFDEKMEQLTSELAEQFEESEILTNVIQQNLGDLGYEF